LIFKVFKISMLLAIIIIIGGCSKIISIGYEKSYCEERGIDYTDAGVCSNPMQIYKNRNNINGVISQCGEQ